MKTSAKHFVLAVRP